VKLATNICHANVKPLNCWKNFQDHGVIGETKAVMTMEIL